MPIYAYRCGDCAGITDRFCSLADAPEYITCEHCSSNETHRIISSVAYHASESTKTAKLDPKYEKMVNHALKKSEGASEHRILDRMTPFSSAKKP